MKKVFSKIFMLSVGALAFTACSDEYDPGVLTKEDILKENYAKHWEDVFGTPDPNQDWSMATPVVANVQVGNNPNVIIYNGKPGYKGTKALGVVNGKSGKLDIVKGTKQVYAVVKDNGKILVSGWFDVVNGVVNINNQPTTISRAAVTRDAETLTVGTKLFTHIAYHPTEYEWDGVTLRLNGAQFIKYENSTYYLSYNNTFEGPYYEITHHVGTIQHEYYNEPYDYWSYDGGEDVEWNLGVGKTVDNVMRSFSLNADGSPIYYETEAYNTSGLRKYESKKHYDAEYHLINGNTLAAEKAEWKIGDCKDLFWTDDPLAFFKEGIDYRRDDKKALYEGQGLTLEDVEEGVVYTTKNEGDPISIPMMYGCTERGNVLGYYYYTDDEDPRTVNRYVLYEDARPTTNIKVDNNDLPTDMYLQQMQTGWTDESVVSCNVRKLVYFDPVTGEGSFEFPADLHVGFFILRQADDYSTLNGATSQVGWAYSDPALCEKYFYDSNGQNATLTENWSYWISTNKEEDKNRGKVKALTWKYGDRILVGFGDQSGDNDLNDFVFWVDGNFKEDPKINIKTEETFTGNSWLFACEDLGGTFDYDFNDVVWEVAQSIKEITTTPDGGDPVTTYEYGDVKVRLLAAGGTMPFTLNFNGNKICTKEEAFGTGVNSTVLIQPTPSQWYTIVTAPGEEWSVVDNKDLFTVVVEGNGTSHNITTSPQANTPYEGTNSTPEVLLLPGDWEWPTEETCIKVAYKDFTEWAYNKDMTGWTSSKVPGKTVSRQ